MKEEPKKEDAPPKQEAKTEAPRDDDDWTHKPATKEGGEKQAPPKEEVKEEPKAEAPPKEEVKEEPKVEASPKEEPPKVEFKEEPKVEASPKVETTSQQEGPRPDLDDWEHKPAKGDKDK